MSTCRFEAELIRVGYADENNENDRGYDPTNDRDTLPNRERNPASHVQQQGKICCDGEYQGHEVNGQEPIRVSQVSLKKCDHLEGNENSLLGSCPFNETIDNWLTSTKEINLPTRILLRSTTYLSLPRWNPKSPILSDSANIERASHRANSSRNQRTCCSCEPPNGRLHQLQLLFFAMLFSVDVSRHLRYWYICSRVVHGEASAVFPVANKLWLACICSATVWCKDEVIPEARTGSTTLPAI